MKLPHLVDQIIHKKKDVKSMFLSLVIDSTYVVGATWDLSEKKLPNVGFISTKLVQQDSWKERITACDQLLVELEEKLEDSVELHEVVLGLPAIYLTADGDIESSTRSEIKLLTKELDLKPIGFVPINHAIVHKFKLNEGVPPSLILLDLDKDNFTLYLYKIGAIAVQKEVSFAEDTIVTDLENAFKDITTVEVLPSRVLLYGQPKEYLEAICQKLLKHPWSTRANFLHFPKIEILSTDDVATAVCLAGASEIATTIQQDDENESQTETINDVAHTVVQTASYVPPVQREESVIEESNVVEVDPESLGFTKPQQANLQENRDVTIEEELAREELEEEDEMVTENPTKHRASDFDFRQNETKQLSAEEKKDNVFKRVRMQMPKMPHMAFSKKLIPISLGIVLIVLAISLYWFLPSATITVVTLPTPLEQNVSLTINPSATIADPASKIIPAKKQEQTVSGQKTTVVTGKKLIGDPAKGEVVIYNKSLTSKTFKKGSVITSGSLQFTLDTDVSVASASEDIGSITFGKAPINVTASSIGSAGNLSSGTEFVFKDFGSSTVIARNDKPFSGGNSHEITVVTRADYDALVATLSAELVTKAKSLLSSSVGGGEHLIESTITTSVKEKKFTEELDQQAKELHGSITIVVSGLTYDQNDIVTLLQSSIEEKVPSGYKIDTASKDVQVGKVTMKKDGTATVDATLKENAIPIIDVSSLANSLAGKSIQDAQTQLKKLQGVAGVEFTFRNSFTKDILPHLSKNISIITSSQ